jgi:hypothetical protein
LKGLSPGDFNVELVEISRNVDADCWRYHMFITANIFERSDIPYCFLDDEVFVTVASMSWWLVYVDMLGYMVTVGALDAADAAGATPSLKFGGLSCSKRGDSLLLFTTAISEVRIDTNWSLECEVL